MADDLILEIEETIKQEKLEKFWKEYGSYIIATIVLIVLCTALLTGWRSWNEKVNTSQTAALISALDSKNPAGELENMVYTLRPNQRAIAQLTTAGILLHDNKLNEALGHYQALAHDSEIDTLYRDLGTLMAVRLSLQMEDNTTSPNDMLAQLKPLWENPKSPWRWHAHEQAALILAHLKNDYAGAREHLGAIMAAQKIPASLQDRARSLNHVYELKLSQSQDKAAAKKDKEEPEG